MSILNKAIVLSLNASWQPIGVRTPRQALIAMSGGNGEIHPAMALDITPKIKDGEPDFDDLEYVNPVGWEEWLKLPVREYDLSIMTSKGPIRAPTVVVSLGFNRMPQKSPRLSKRAIMERDQMTCQYSGERLTFKDLNLDHVVPRDKGGRDSWENLVTSKKSINSMKGNRHNHEVGLKLIRPPKAPPSIPVMATIREAKHDSWRPFIVNK